MKWLLGHDGLLWFLGASYRYVGPRGFVAHARFAWALPGATWRYMRMRATNWQGNGPGAPE